tara:strand:- start:7710 stop:8861 length:1152 start_codon:yes stop_codon:yes gene_type:complete
MAENEALDSTQDPKEKVLGMIKKAIGQLKDKENKIFFFCMDSKGRAMASIATIYEHAKILKELGYNVTILTEKNDYTKPGSWLGAEYDELDHQSSENEGTIITPQDFIILPEVYGGILEQLKSANCEKVIFTQAYDYIFELMKPGETWGQWGVRKCITTTKSQSDYIKTLFPNIDTSIIKLGIPDYFTGNSEPRKPFIAIHSRDARDTANFIKSFYIKHPFLKWITFRDMRGLTRTEFAESLRESALSIWIDKTAGCGTFPLESMKCKTPVIGVLPTLPAEWLNEKNGIWTQNHITLVDTVAGVMKSWLEDSIPQELYDEMEKTANEYTMSQEAQQVADFYESFFKERINELTLAMSEEESRSAIKEPKWSGYDDPIRKQNLK